MCTCLQSCEQSLVTCTWTTVLRTMSTHVYTVKKGKKEQVQETITTSITGNLNGEKMTWKRKKKTWKKWMTHNPSHTVSQHDVVWHPINKFPIWSAEKLYQSVVMVTNKRAPCLLWRQLEIQGGWYKYNSSISIVTHTQTHIHKNKQKNNNNNWQTVKLSCLAACFCGSRTKSVKGKNALPEILVENWLYNWECEMVW